MACFTAVGAGCNVAEGLVPEWMEVEPDGGMAYGAGVHTPTCTMSPRRGL